jgi:hypothetical protein|tara:strand:+ start:1623 stop:1928 length:306 start_codon:yes stop_codon:yes gene_type:complete
VFLVHAPQGIDGFAAFGAPKPTRRAAFISSYLENFACGGCLAVCAVCRLEFVTQPPRLGVSRGVIHSTVPIPNLIVVRNHDAVPGKKRREIVRHQRSGFLG